MSDKPPLPPTSIEMVRVFAAPVAEVFTAWTDPELLQRWLAPWPCKVLEAAADARPGGRYRIVVGGPLGGKTVTKGEYLEVVPNQRLVQTWVVEGKKAAGDYPTLLTVEFRELGPRSTEITLRQDQLLTIMDREGNRGGWRSCWKKLEALLAKER